MVSSIALLVAIAFMVFSNRDSENMASRDRTERKKTEEADRGGNLSLKEAFGFFTNPLKFRAIEIDKSEPVFNGNNANNSGFAAESAEWIYYSFGFPGIFRMRHDGTGQVKICDDSALYLNLAPDGWLYYKKINGDNGIYKIRTDGTERSLVLEGYNDSPIVYGDYLYYLYKEKPFSEGVLCRRSLDGTTDEVVSLGKIDFFNIFQNTIYYFVIYDRDHYELRKMNLDGSGDKKETLRTDSVKCLNVSDLLEMPVYLEGDSVRSVSGYMIIAESNSLVLYGDYMYYSNENALYKYGKKEEVIYKGAVTSLNIAGGKIFFGAPVTPEQYFFMDLDGSNIKPLGKIPDSKEEIGEDNTTVNVALFDYQELEIKNYDEARAYGLATASGANSNVLSYKYDDLARRNLCKKF
jgi:hypothetical protein